MRKLTGCLLLLIVLLAACQDDEWNSNERVNPHKELIDGAREYFEETIIEAATRGSLVQDKLWSPGDVTPSWNDVRIKKDKNYEYIMVPIYAENNYVSQERVVRDSVERVYNSKVWQFLFVRRNTEGEYSAAYITLLPPKSYYVRHRNQVLDKFLDAPTFHGDFTGHVIYNDLVNFNLLAIDKIKNGQVHWGFSRWTEATAEAFNESCHKMLRNISILKVVATRTDFDGGQLEDVVINWCSKCGVNMDGGHSCGNNSGGYGENYGDYYGGGSTGGLDWDWGSGSDSGSDSGYGFGSGGSGGSGSSGNGNNNNNNGNSNQTITDKLYDSKSTLTTAQKQSLTKAISELQTNSIMNKLINELAGMNVKLIFNINSSLEDPAQFNGKTGEISFREPTTITAHSAREEFVHAMQWYGFYGNKMNNEIRNYEFEAKLFMDMVSVNAGAVGGSRIIGIGMDENKNFMTMYDDFLEGFYDSNAKFTSQYEEMYYSLGRVWDQYTGTWYDNISPELIKKYFK